MFGFLAAFGPVGIVAAVVGTVGAAVLVSGDSSSKRSSSSGSADRARERNKDNERSSIKSEIKEFEAKSITQIKSKYNIDISFDKKVVDILDSKYSNSKTIKKHISTLETTNNEMINLIKMLKDSKDEIK